MGVLDFLIQNSLLGDITSRLSIREVIENKHKETSKKQSKKTTELKGTSVEDI